MACVCRDESRGDNPNRRDHAEIPLTNNGGDTTPTLTTTKSIRIGKHIIISDLQEKPSLPKAPPEQESVSYGFILKKGHTGIFHSFALKCHASSELQLRF